MSITYVVIEGIISVVLFLHYRKNKPLYAYVLAVFILIDLVVRLSSLFIYIPTIIKSLSSGFVDLTFIIFLFYWAKEADETLEDTDGIRIKRQK